MNKEILNGFKAIEKLAKGSNKLANAVKITLGPKGRNVVLERKYSSPLITNDGVTIAKEINFEDSFENMGAELIKEASIKTNDIAGDGTTTACVLANTIIQEGLKSYSAGVNPLEIKNGIEIAKNIVLEELNKLATPITTNKEIFQIASISAGNEEIGKLIAEGFEKVGKNGVISVEEGKSFKTTLKIVEGLQFDRGYLSPYMANTDSLTAEFDNAYVLLYQNKINNINDIINILEFVSKNHKPLLIICDDMENDVLATLVLNKLRGNLNVVAVKSPAFADKREAIMEDIATLCGGEVYSPLNIASVNNLTDSILGEASKIKVTKDYCLIKNGKGNKDKIIQRIELIKKQIELCDNDFDKTSLQERLSKLNGGIAVIEVGSATDAEMQEKKLRIEDAISATKSAVEEGIVAGGGVALINCYKKLKEEIKNFNADEIIGANIVLKALTSPIIQIAENAGVSGEVIINNIVLSNKTNYGYNAKNNEYVDMFKCGIIDPTKVTKTALISACSVASTMLTTGCAIAESKEIEEKK